MNSSVSDELVLRPMREADRNYVLSSWSKSYAGSSRDARDYATMADFYRDYAPVIAELLARSVVTVAALKDNDDIIVGWSAIEGDVLHYVLVKPRWRKLGVARYLLSSVKERPMMCSHQTNDAVRCGMPDGWAYRRFKIWRTGDTLGRHA